MESDTYASCRHGQHSYPPKLDRYCGAKVCDDCGDHKGLDRCYCGWTRYGQPGRGADELIEMGETIDPEE